MEEINSNLSTKINKIVMHTNTYILFRKYGLVFGLIKKESSKRDSVEKRFLY